MIPVVVRVPSCDECPFLCVDTVLEDQLQIEALAGGEIECADPSAAWLCTQGGECTTEGAPPADCPLRSSSIVVTLAEGV